MSVALMVCAVSLTVSAMGLFYAWIQSTSRRWHLRSIAILYAEGLEAMDRFQADPPWQVRFTKWENRITSRRRRVRKG